MFHGQHRERSSQQGRWSRARACWQHAVTLSVRDNNKQFHEKTHVIPQRHNQDHGLGKGFAHLGKTTTLIEDVGVTESSLLSRAVVLGDRVARNTCNQALRVRDNLAVLYVEPLDLAKATRRIREELSHNGKLLSGVEVEAGARAIESSVALTITIEITTIGVAVSSVAVRRVSSAASITFAGVVANIGAGMGSVGGGDAVGLPDIHLRAAGTLAASTSVSIVG